MMRTTPTVIAILATSSLAFTLQAADSVDFRRDVRPILSDKCFHCHGPDEATREADLRLDQKEEADYVLEEEDAELLRRIRSDDPDERMPPANSKLELSAEEIATLDRWIRQGAPYAQHWSFSPIGKTDPPESENAAWSQSEIDRFVFQHLKERGLTPNATADKATLVRRLTFDLTGLPPTIAEVDAFLTDQSADAYEHLVDRLLDGEAYGERMAVDWLDTARYSDTYGYQVDRDRFVWPWRDWVIRAFNSNLPYDEFITWQLAGDLLPNATTDQILATTFNRLHPQKVEGGSVPEEFRVEYVADRTHTVATAFLGLTFECARCHDHKYDPITQREYYQLFAYFNNIDEAGLYSYFTNSVPTPTLLLVEEAQQKSINDVEARIRVAEEKLAEIERDGQDRFQSWQSSSVPSAMRIPGQIAHLEFEEPQGGNRLVPGRNGMATQLTGDDGIDVGVGNFSRNQPFSIALWMKTPDLKERAVVFHRSRAWTDAASRGYQLLLENGRLSASLIHFWPGNAIRVWTVDPIALNEWVHVTMVYDGSSRAAGIQLFVNGLPASTEVVRDRLYKNITGGGGDTITIGERFRDRGFTGGLVDDFRVFDRALTSVEVEHLVDGQTLDGLLADARPDPRLRSYYFRTVDVEYQAALADLQAARVARSQATDELQEIMVMRELEPQRPTHLLRRGAYDQPADPLGPGTPAALPAPAAEVRADRLGLAKWLVSRDHPLTSRVAVNRFWKMCFGYGLVRTPEDFGSQGEAPTHPELLDWLAADFQENGWDTKRLLKQIVMSATYRQDSTATAAEWKADPENRQLARGPRYRWPAEMLRDNALAASGLLVPKIGGAPVKPYDLAVSFKPLPVDQGEGLYRRSLYTFWKRTAPSPVMMTLDASKRDVCTVKRERTASPLQAFVMMNDPQIIEASRELARDLLQKYPPDSTELLIEAFRRLTTRRPTESELAVLEVLRQEQLDHFQAHESAADALLSVGSATSEEKLPSVPLATITMVVNTIMNSDACMTKR